MKVTVRDLFFLIQPLLFTACLVDGENGNQVDWPAYLGDKGSAQYSKLKQINTTNVTALEQTWIYQSGDARRDNRSQIQCNPLIVNGTLYATNPSLKLFALEAATGKELWTFTPSDSASAGYGVNRGVTYWSNGGQGRILYTSGSFLHAVNAVTGALIDNFGKQGTVDLREGLGRDPKILSVIANTPGVIYRNLLIQGSRVFESPGAAPGHIRAYDLNTGEIVWTFHTIPQPGEFGYETWPPDAWKYIGGANSWAGMSLDEELGIVYIPTGSAAFDFYGGNRLGQNLFANCLLALDASTGERKWHFQIVHHDLWDRDLPAPPNLITVDRDGQQIKAVAQVTKSGHVFVFDRITGEPLFPIEELSYPDSELEGEETWPTQPLPIRPPPFARQELTEDMINDLFGEIPAYIEDFVKDASHPPMTLRQQLLSVQSKGQFIPVSLQGNIMFPGFDGGAEWGGAAYDPHTGWLYVNANEMPWIYRSRELKSLGGNRVMEIGKNIFGQQCARCHGVNAQNLGINIPSLEDLNQRLSKKQVIDWIKKGKGEMPAFKQLSETEIEIISAFLLEMDSVDIPIEDIQTQNPAYVKYSLGSFGRFLDEKGFPAVKPPWGTLNAIDLNQGEIIWQVPLGEFEELTNQGFPITGTENYGGPVVTDGGLIFIAATKDEKFRAFDKKSGKMLWQTSLPTGGYATPATYMVGGKQYVVIACGGGKMGTKSGDSYVAFSLPD